MTARLRSESGQAVVVTVVFMTVLVAAVAFSLDVGSWYRERRQAQTAADAAALSGAQSLPQNTSQASSTVTSYANENGGGVDAAGGIAFSSAFEPNDTVTVKITRTAPGFFSRIFSIDSVQVHASATARSAVPQDVKDVAPIAVWQDQEKLLGTPGCPCFNQWTSIPLGKVGVPGGFTMMDLDKYQATVNGSCPTVHGGGNQGSSDLAQWITTGYDQYLNLGCYASDPGAKFNASDIQSALTSRLGTVLLFPIYSDVAGNGSNAYYDIIGWAAFDLQTFSVHGNSGELDGWFKQVIWDGIQSTTSPTNPDFGVHTIALIN